MEQMGNHSDHDHIIDIKRGGDPSSSSSLNEQLQGEEPSQNDSQPSRPTQTSTRETLSTASNRLSSTNLSVIRRGEGNIWHHRNPFYSGLWISVEMIVTVCQITASIVVLSLSRNEKPRAPLFEWVVGYASGCVATLPILYWRYCNLCREQDANRSPTSSNQSSIGENNQPGSASSTNNHVTGSFSVQYKALADHFKMALDCFFAVWFIVGNVWIFGGHISPSDSPQLYRLCIAFLAFSCIGYAMPFILCATICCCLPCLISILGFREEFSQTKGATPEIINALPVYKFKLKKNRNSDDPDINSGTTEGGILAGGSEKERAISAEDAVCSICLAKYADNDELRELPCLHFFHVECVDKWLKINALCPLCKSDVDESTAASPATQDSIRQRGV